MMMYASLLVALVLHGAHAAPATTTLQITSTNSYKSSPTLCEHLLFQDVIHSCTDSRSPAADGLMFEGMLFLPHSLDYGILIVLLSPLLSPLDGIASFYNNLIFVDVHLCLSQTSTFLEMVESMPNCFKIEHFKPSQLDLLHH